MRRNPLARLLFEHAGKACLADEHAAADLLQADDDHVCAVAVRAMTSDDPRALPLARQNLDRLLAALDRPLPRAVARQALRALDKVADAPGSAERHPHLGARGPRAARFVVPNRGADGAGRAATAPLPRSARGARGAAGASASGGMTMSLVSSRRRCRAWLTRTRRSAIRNTERARWRATSQQCPGASPGRRIERITSPRFPAPKARGGHESRASQVVGLRALSPSLPGLLAVGPTVLIEFIRRLFGRTRRRSRRSAAAAGSDQTCRATGSDQTCSSATAAAKTCRQRQPAAAAFSSGTDDSASGPEHGTSRSALGANGSFPARAVGASEREGAARSLAGDAARATASRPCNGGTQAVAAQRTGRCESGREDRRPDPGPAGAAQAAPSAAGTA